MNLLPLTFFHKKKKKDKLGNPPRLLTQHSHSRQHIISAYSLLELSQLQHCLDHPKHLVLLQVWRYCFFIYHF